MKIIRSYVIRECVLPFFLALVVLTCVFLLGYLVQLAHWVINKGISIATIGKVFMLYIPVLLGYTLPIACLMGIILGFSRLSADNEILAIRACGVYLKQLFTPLVMIGIILSLVLFILNDRIVPYAYHEQKTMLKTLGTKNPTALMEPGIFINAFEGLVLFIHKIEGNKMYNITIYQPQGDDKPTRTIIARKGEFTAVPDKDQVILKLIEGTSDEPDKENPNNFYKLNFDTTFKTISISKEKRQLDKKPKSMSLSELRAEKERLQRLFVETTRLDTERFRKITWSFAPLVFVLIGFPMAVITNRREKTASVVLAFMCAAGYYLLSYGFEALSLEHMAPPAVIMWGPNAIGFITGIILNIKLYRS